MRVVFMMMGLPRSGKTTEARRLSEKKGWPHVCPDCFRLAIHGQPFILEQEAKVWDHVRVAVAALFNAGHEVIILDGTFVRRDRRDHWRKLGYDVLVKEIKTPADVCKQRAIETGRDYLIPVIDKMAGEYEPLAEYEVETIARLTNC